MELRPYDPTHIGPYVLLARLGAGGMGQVYLGRSPGGLLVAIKVIKEEILEHPDVVARFCREVETVRSVRGPYIANLVNASLDAGAPPLWLATEYVAGPTLAKAVAASGPMPASTCQGLLAAMAEGLAAVHAHGVTHRDLKPQNVILSAQGPQLIDFGIARAVGHLSLTETGHVTGTPGFTAPEVLTESRTTPAADVFALGATVAYAATGRPPFGGGTAVEINYRAVDRPADLVGIEPELAALLAACLAKDPAARPALGEVIARCAVQTVLPEDSGYRAVAGLVGQVGGPALYTPTEVARPVRTFWDRARWKAGVAAGVAAVVLATFGILWAGGVFDREQGGEKGQAAPSAESPGASGTPSVGSSPSQGASGSPSSSGPPAFIYPGGPNRDLWSSDTKRCNLPEEDLARDFQFDISAKDLGGYPVRGKQATVGFRFKFTVPGAGTGTPYYVSVGVKEPGDPGVVSGPNLSIGATSRPIPATAGGQSVQLTYPDDFRSWAEDGSSHPATAFNDAPGDWTVLFFHVTDPANFQTISCAGFHIS